jgi:pyruvate,water dikinase
MEELMSTKFILPLNDLSPTLETVGGKGVSLSRMANAGFPVPDGYHITTLAYRRFVEENNLQHSIMESLEQTDISNPESLAAASQEISALFFNAAIPADVAKAVLQAYADLPGLSPAVAVRSSATAEDLPEASFAGQQETFLNISGADALLEATRKCWASLWTARAIGYRARQNIAAEGVALAVVVQLLIPAEAAGIMFTANPINGERNQVVINASWGLGDAVVGGLVTPDTLTLEKSSGNILNRGTAKKLVQTVRVNGGTQEQPIPENLCQVPVLNDQQATELAGLGKDIEALYHIPMDIEWTLADGKFAVVQARPITALPEPEPPVPTEWNLPEGAYAAMRNNIVELMADPLTPLFKTLGLRAVNKSMGNLLTGFFGNQDVMPGELIISVNEYAYYNGSVKFGPMMKIILDTPGIMRRMFIGAVERWTEEGRPRYIETITKWQSTEWRELSSTELLEAVDELAEAAIDAYGSLVSGVIPAAWISEALFTLIYKLVRRRDDPTAPTFLMGFDSLPIRAEKSLFDISKWIRESEELTAYLKDTTTIEIVAHLNSDRTPEYVNEIEWRDWQHRFRAHLQEYGHTIYNLDFANPVPADDPTPVLETLKLFVNGQGVNPYERQKASAERREQASQSMQKRLKGVRLNIFQKNLDRAQRYAPLREDGLADVGMSYPLLRQMLSELGQRFTEAGLIDQTNDIYWLEQDEVEKTAASLDRGEELSSLAEVIPQRKAIWQSANRAAPPMALPQIKIFGFDVMKLKSGRARKDGEDTLKGVAASPGTVTAPASVLHGPEDFSKMRTGNVLVASITTPAWTPLFARAAAVVTDIGGPLSHGSIVAREYGIPAVLGTDSATKHIQDGQTITVDGDTGLVTLLQDRQIETN